VGYGLGTRDPGLGGKILQPNVVPVGKVLGHRAYDPGGGRQGGGRSSGEAGNPAYLPNIVCGCVILVVLMMHSGVKKYPNPPHWSVVLDCPAGFFDNGSIVANS